MKVLVISTHPDDETLGAGGTMLRHLAAGDSLAWAIVTVTSEPRWSKDVIDRKGAEVERVAERYCCSSLSRLRMPATRLDSVPQVELMDGLHDVIAQTSPERVYVVHGGDVHSDHRAVFTATMSVLKPFHMSRLGVRQVLSYETLSSTDAAPVPLFVPNVFRDITPYLDQKIAIMRLFATEAQDALMPRSDSSIRALARYRGATIGVEYAEAFMLVRDID
jgi:LmbE family N-acetylglucosaminyl deacetylase